MQRMSREEMAGLAIRSNVDQLRGKIAKARDVVNFLIVDTCEEKKALEYVRHVLCGLEPHLQEIVRNSDRLEVAVKEPSDLPF